jgi:hypothetical protein
MLTKLLKKQMLLFYLLKKLLLRLKPLLLPLKRNSLLLVQIQVKSLNKTWLTPKVS